MTIEYVAFGTVRNSTSQKLSPSAAELDIGLTEKHVAGVQQWRTDQTLMTTRVTFTDLCVLGNPGKLYKDGAVFTGLEDLQFAIDPSTSGNMRRTYNVLYLFTIPTTASRQFSGASYQPLNGSNGKSYYWWGFGDTEPASTNHKSTKVYLNAPDNATGWQSYNTLSLDGPWKHQIDGAQETRWMWWTLATEVVAASGQEVINGLITQEDNAYNEKILQEGGNSGSGNTEGSGGNELVDSNGNKIVNDENALP